MLMHRSCFTAHCIPSVQHSLSDLVNNRLITVAVLVVHSAFKIGFGLCVGVQECLVGMAMFCVNRTIPFCPLGCGDVDRRIAGVTIQLCL